MIARNRNGTYGRCSGKKYADFQVGDLVYLSVGFQEDHFRDTGYVQCRIRQSGLIDVWWINRNVRSDQHPLTINHQPYKGL